MIQPITYQNHVLSHLQENEIRALIAIAPYWGLAFDEDTRSLKHALSDKNVFVECENDQHSLRSLLMHTDVHYSDNAKRCDLSIQVFSIEHEHHIPISININNVKYHLKYMKNYHKDLQFLIHRSVWLPKRDENFAITFCHFSSERQMEIIAYLIIQFFLRDEMTSISHIPFPVYEKIITQVLHPINPHFAHAQMMLYNTIWPETPPELTKPDQHTSNDSPPNYTFNPFKKNSSILSQQQNPINPFERKKTINRDPINPFKKKTRKHE